MKANGGPKRELRLLASVAREMLGSFCPRAGPSSSSGARAHGRLGLRLPAQSPPSGLSSGAPMNRAVLLDRLNGCSPKPSNQDRPSLFRELNALNPQQHVARI